MTPDLRDHFDLAVGDDPGASLDDLAHAAIAEGGRLRRRRIRMTAASVAAGVLAVAGVAVGVNLSSATEPPVTLAAAMQPVTASSCLPQPVETDATDVMIFLDGAQRPALETALRKDPRVGALLFESREQAYERFRARYAHNPDLLAAVAAGRFPESFRLRLGAPEQYAGFRLRYAAMDGVASVVGRRCAPDAPVGGVL